MANNADVFSLIGTFPHFGQGSNEIDQYSSDTLNLDQFMDQPYTDQQNQMLQSMHTVSDDEWKMASDFLGYDVKSSFMHIINSPGISIDPTIKDAGSWITKMVDAKQGNFAATIDFLAAQYMSDTGQIMTSDLRNKFLNALKNAPFEVQNSITKSATSAATSGTGVTSAPTIPGFLQDMYSAAVSASPGKQTQYYNTAYTKAFGKQMTDDQLAQIKGMNDAQFQLWMDSQPFMGGLNYGAYNSGMNRLQGPWQQYFGKDPSVADIQWSVGKSSQDIQDYINMQPSHVAGVQIGQYETLSKNANSVSNDLYGHPADQHMIDELTKAMK